MNIKKVKNRGFSLFVSIVASLILMGVSVAIIASINRSLDQATNIARSNQAFFALESGREAALFHHGVRGAGLKWDVDSNQVLKHGAVGNGAAVSWGVDGREDVNKIIRGVVHENEKVTIPFYFDSSDNSGEAESIANLSSTVLKSIRIYIGNSSVFEDPANNEVAIIWSVSRRKILDNSIETWIPQAFDESDPCVGASSSYFCKSDFLSYSGTLVRHFIGGIINFSSSKKGRILPQGTGNIPIRNFVGDADYNNYELSFQPVLPFIDTSGKKFDSLKFEIWGDSPIKIPRNIYTITTKVDFGDFEKTEITTLKEKSSIGAFDYLIFK